MLLSCQQETESPQQTASRFVKLLNLKEFDKAKELATDNSATNIEMIRSLYLKDSTSFGSYKIRKTKVIQKNKKIQIYYTNNGNIQSFFLLNTNGKWKVDFEIEDQLESDLEKVEEFYKKARETSAENAEKILKEDSDSGTTLFYD